MSDVYNKIWLIDNIENDLSLVYDIMRKAIEVYYRNEA